MFLAPDFCLSGKIHRTNWESVDFVTNDLFQKQFHWNSIDIFQLGLKQYFYQMWCDYFRMLMLIFKTSDHKDMPKLWRGVPPLVWHLFNRLSGKVFSHSCKSLQRQEVRICALAEAKWVETTAYVKGRFENGRELKAGQRGRKIMISIKAY